MSEKDALATLELRVLPMETAPSGDEALEPTEIEVHEGSWAVVYGTNAKPIGWIDTHALFAGKVYRDHFLNPTHNPDYRMEGRE